MLVDGTAGCNTITVTQVLYQPVAAGEYFLSSVDQCSGTNTSTWRQLNGNFLIFYSSVDEKWYIDETDCSNSASTRLGGE